MYDLYRNVVLSLGLIAIGAIIAGVLRRRRYRYCTMFLVYLIAVLTTDLLPTLWPDRFNNGNFWLVRESIHNAAR